MAETDPLSRDSEPLCLLPSWMADALERAPQHDAVYGISGTESPAVTCVFRPWLLNDPPEDA